MSIPDDKVSELSTLLFQGRKIEAIRLHRELTGEGLKESKDAIDALDASLRQSAPEKYTAGAGKGCLGAAGVICLCGTALTCWFMA